MCFECSALYDRKEYVEPHEGVNVFNKVLRESERDSARIIHSAAFRRLQNKMQVQVIGDSDYYRTRLTHTFEVMQIARGIFYFLHDDINDKLGDYSTNIHLIEAVCFAHDIGHPPFGHAGEVALNKCMKKYGGFEGNAQTLHVLSTGHEHSENNGFNLMRRTLLGVIKYPVKYSVLKNKDLEEIKPPKCIYDIEEKVLEWVLEPFKDDDKNLFQKYISEEGKHGKSIYKSFDCSIMNMADDIAYACHDLEDSIKLSLLKMETLKNILKHEDNINTVEFLLNNLKLKDNIVIDKNESLEKRIDIFVENLYSGNIKSIFSSLIGFFIYGCIVDTVDGFSHPLLKYNISFKSEEYNNVLKLLKDTITYEHVISNYKIKQLESKGQYMVKKVFNAFFKNSQLLPYAEQKAYNECDAKADKARVVCDYIAGMSDSFLTKIYSRLFIPDYGSIGDLL